MHYNIAKCFAAPEAGDFDVSNGKPADRMNCHGRNLQVKDRQTYFICKNNVHECGTRFYSKWEKRKQPETVPFSLNERTLKRTTCTIGGGIDQDVEQLY